MKELGTLAIVCAQRPDVLLQIYDGYATVYVGEGTERAYMTAKWEDDEAINSLILQLNFGKYAVKKRNETDAFRNAVQVSMKTS